MQRLLHSDCTRSVCNMFSFRIVVMKIPGLSFSLKRAVGITAAKRKISRATGIPTSRAGLERKIGGLILGALFGNGKKRGRKR